MTFQPGEWAGNRWPSIDIEPDEHRHFLPVLMHVCATHGVPMPGVVDLLDGYAADFLVDGIECRLLMDIWAFSFGCANIVMRDRVLADLRSLPDQYFESAAKPAVEGP